MRHSPPQGVQEIIRAAHSMRPRPLQAGLPDMVMNAVLNGESQPRLPVQFSGQLAKIAGKAHCIGQIVANHADRHQGRRRVHITDDIIARHDFGLA